MGINLETNTYRKSAIIVGVLFIIATVVSILGSLVILAPILDAPDYLVQVYENQTQVIFGVLIDAINSLAIIGIGVLLYPILKKEHEGLAMGYVGFRILESVILILGTVSLLSLVTLSQEYAQSAAAEASYFQALGDLILAVGDWAQMLGAMVVLSLNALILNYLLFQSRCVPRFISVWGLIAAALMLAAGLLGVFGLGYLSPVTILMGLPLALNEMVFAVWLIVKGFQSPAVVSRFSKAAISVN